MASSKKIDDLVGDIFSLLVLGGKAPDPENLKRYLDLSSETITRYMTEGATKPDAAPSFRMSKVGTPFRRAWFEWNRQLPAPINGPDVFKDGPLQFRFLMGSLIEHLLLFFAIEAGHTVSRAQEDVELEGVPGHPDGCIDGYLTDVKTASPYGFDKFSEGKIFSQDDWGYLWQLSAYKESMGLPATDPAYFLAFNKSSCEMVLLEVRPHHLPDARAKIRELQKVVKLPTPPPAKCWQPVVETNGNKKLHDNCRFCPFKDECWKDANGGRGLRKFRYARRIEFLTEIVSTPRVEEIL